MTTMSASRARARDASAKHSAPNGQRGAPTHSRAGIETEPPGLLVDARVQLVPVAGLGLVGPVPQPLHLLAEPAGLTEPLRAAAGRAASKRVSSGSSSAELSSRARQR